MPQFLVAAKYPKVALKTIGAPGCSAKPFPLRDMYGCIQQLISAYGPQRLFSSTDITHMPYRGRWCVMLFTEGLAWLKGRDLAQVMGCAVGDWISRQR
jgi:hypothetical protein